MDVTELMQQLQTATARIIAIDGNCCSGKSSLAAALAEGLGATVFHMDDFFLRPQQRTAERLAEVGGNVDRERFLKEVLLPVTAHDPVYLRRYDCRTQTLCPAVVVTPAQRVIVEGSYALHPLLRPYYDLKIRLCVDPAVQRERILQREGANAERFFSLWLPMEDAYFASLEQDAADIVIDTSTLPQP